jgi:hypothetical protein
MGVAVEGIPATQDKQGRFILPLVKSKKSSLNIGVIVT